MGHEWRAQLYAVSQNRDHIEYGFDQSANTERHCS